MEKWNLKISELEKIIKASSRYISRVDETLGQTDQAKAKIDKVQQYLKERGLNGDILSVFGDAKNIGMVYVELPQGTREFHGQAAQMLMDCCRYDVEGQPSENAWDKWRDFGRTIYYGTIEEVYNNFTTVKPELALIFELAYRQLMGEAAVLWWEQQQELMTGKKQEIMHRFNLEITALLRPLRDKILQKHSVDSGVFEKLLDHGWDVNFDLENPQARQITVLLRETNLSEWMLSELFHLLYTDQMKTYEEEIWEKLNLSSFSKPEEIISLISGKLSQVTELAAKEIQKIVVKKASELEIKLNQENSDLQKYTARIKKQTQELVGMNNSDMTNVVEGKLYSENLINLSAKVTDSLMQFQRNLTGQLWYLQDLERKEKALQTSIERCQSIQRMPLKDLITLLTADAAETSTDLMRHINLYNQLDINIKKDWAGLTKNIAKILVELIRQGLEHSQNKVKALDKDITKRNLQSPQAIATLIEIEQAQADGRAISRLIEEKGGNRAYHVEILMENYRRLLKDIIEPLINYRRLSSMVKLWPPLLLKDPPILRQQELFDEIFYLTERLKRYNRFFSFVAQGAIVPALKTGDRNDYEIREQVFKNYSRTVSVLVYDIRGSEFLSAKLLNAGREREIKNKIGYLITQIIKQHGGFIVKDTGGGGLAWFGDNAPELYEKCFKEVFTGKGLKLRHSINSGTELNILPSTESSKQAVDCACEMFMASEKFILENFSNYKDWFRESKEGEKIYEGISQTMLPSVFQSLFKLGIGISSGAPGREICLALNTCGDTDLCGTAVDNARLYAIANRPSDSKILLDHVSFANLLLNAERYSSLMQERLWNVKTVGVDNWENKLREGLNLAESTESNDNFYFPGRKYSLKRTGYQLMGQSAAFGDSNLNQENYDKDLSILADGRFYDLHDKTEVRFIYEVQPQEKGDI